MPFNFTIMAVVDSVINGALGLVGQGAQMAFETSQAQKEREWNEAMMEKQNEWNLNMWNMTNEYNSPAAQRQRLEDAGLNPLFFGLDGSSAAPMESAQALGYQRASMAGMENPIQAALNASLTQAQIENVRSDTGLKTNQSESEIARRENIITETKKANQEIENLIKEGNLTDYQVAELKKTISWIDALNTAAVNSQKAQTSFTQAQEKRLNALLPKELMKADVDIREVNKAIDKMNAEIDKIVAETYLTKEDIYWYTATHMDSGILGTGLSARNISIAIEEFLKEHPKLHKLMEDGLIPNLSPNSGGSR